MMPPYSILLVEDSLLTRRMIRSMLLRQGEFDVIEAADGSEALRLLETQRVDVVVSDLHMQPMDGHALRDAIRGQPRLAHLPFVMMTSRPCPDSIRRTVGDMRGHYLPKPFTRDQLLVVLDRVLGRWAA